ncbi:hypothetical protein BG258_09005 [Lysinibacillus fusiformis]|uniref:Uncharacterized protein n=1 Tax=Lysinibacillus fusiformis TaxID=28031 RepID=A0A1E4R6F1_9BACI|nr:hypothetical protein BG258_09005 [Lysinibacillus fusiformis]
MELMADIRPNKKPHAYTKGTEKVHIFFSFGTVALLLFSEAFRSLSAGERCFSKQRNVSYSYFRHAFLYNKRINMQVVPQ